VGWGARVLPPLLVDGAFLRDRTGALPVRGLGPQVGVSRKGEGVYVGRAKGRGDVGKPCDPRIA